MAPWDDVFEITVVPAIATEEVGLRVAKPMCDAPITASFTEVPGRGVLGSPYTRSRIAPVL